MRSNLIATGGGLVPRLFNMFSGGALENFDLRARSMPYVTRRSSCAPDGRRADALPPEQVVRAGRQDHQSTPQPIVLRWSISFSARPCSRSSARRGARLHRRRGRADPSAFRLITCLSLTPARRSCVARRADPGARIGNGISLSSSPASSRHAGASPSCSPKSDFDALVLIVTRSSSSDVAANLLLRARARRIPVRTKRWAGNVRRTQTHLPLISTSGVIPPLRSSISCSRRRSPNGGHPRGASLSSALQRATGARGLFVAIPSSSRSSTRLSRHPSTSRRTSKGALRPR